MTDNNALARLDVCRFCQSKAVRVARIRISTDMDWWQTECQNCGAHGPHRTTEAEAVTAWNTRTPAPASVEVGELVSKLRSEGCRNGGDGSYAWRARELCTKAANMLERLAGPVQQSGVEQVAFAIIEGSAGRRAAEHAQEFQTANWEDAIRSARAALAAMQPATTSLDGEG